MVYSTRRFVVYLSVCHLVFFSPFSIAITSLGEERANLRAFHTYVRFVLVWICRFPLPLVVWEGLRFVIVALPGLFSYLFFNMWFVLFLSVLHLSFFRCNGNSELLDCAFHGYLYLYFPGLSCSKLTTSLVNDSLTFTSNDTQYVESFC